MEGHTNPSYSDQHGQSQKYGISMQPVAGAGAVAQGQWAARPATFAGCPPGLEYLLNVDQLVMKQQKEKLEVLTGWEQVNKYRILNSVGQQVFFASEESKLCERQCCGPMRGFVLHILDNMGQEVIRIHRELQCCAGCCWCANSNQCALVLRVEAPVGTPVGYVRQECSKWKPHYTIRTPDHQPVGIIRGTCCFCTGPCCEDVCCDDVEFHIRNHPSEDTQIGKIAKQWSGMHEFFTDADTFCVTFPMDMDVRTKATFIGAVFLIDFMFFEKKNN